MELLFSESKELYQYSLNYDSQSGFQQILQQNMEKIFTKKSQQKENIQEQNNIKQAIKTQELPTQKDKKNKIITVKKNDLVKTIKKRKKSEEDLFWEYESKEILKWREIKEQRQSQTQLCIDTISKRKQEEYNSLTSQQKQQIKKEQKKLKQKQQIEALKEKQNQKQDQNQEKTQQQKKIKKHEDEEEEEVKVFKNDKIYKFFDNQPLNYVDQEDWERQQQQIKEKQEELKQKQEEEYQKNKHKDPPTLIEEIDSFIEKNNYLKEKVQQKKTEYFQEKQQLQISQDSQNIIKTEKVDLNINKKKYTLSDQEQMDLGEKVQNLIQHHILFLKSYINRFKKQYPQDPKQQMISIKDFRKGFKQCNINISYSQIDQFIYYFARFDDDEENILYEPLLQNEKLYPIDRKKEQYEKLKPYYDSILKGIYERIESHMEGSHKTLKQLFEKIDLDHNQELDQEEFTMYIRKMGIDIKQFEAEIIFQQIDLNHDGQLQFNELQNFFNKQFKKYKNSKELKEKEDTLSFIIKRINNCLEEKQITPQQFFQNIDNNKSNEIEEQELKIGLQRIGIQVSFKDMKTLKEFMDRDNDGIISLYEFESCLKRPISSLVIARSKLLTKEKIKKLKQFFHPIRKVLLKHKVDLGFAFGKLDWDSDSKFSVADLKDVLQQMYFPDDKIADITYFVQQQLEGYILYDEFENIIRIQK